MICWAYVSLQFEGYHQWQEAPLPVAFLRFKHRHIFHVKVYIEQFHNDRDIEYILFQRWLCNYVVDQLDTDHLGSCEMIAEFFIEQIRQRYKDRGIKVDVSEDGENGALLEDIV